MPFSDSATFAPRPERDTCQPFAPNRVPIELYEHRTPRQPVPGIESFNRSQRRITAGNEIGAYPRQPPRSSAWSPVRGLKVASEILEVVEVGRQGCPRGVLAADPYES